MPEQKSAMAGRRFRQVQRGAALLIFMILMVTAALTYVVTSLTPEAIEARRAQKTQEALSQARDALLAYAQLYRETQASQGQYDRVYGYLPLPDLGSSRNNNAGCAQEGCEAANFSGNALNTTVIGRLPWRTLGIPPLRDGAGECLWYVVSGSHQRQQRSTPMNPDTLGHLDVVVANGTGALVSALANAHDRPMAILFTPGPPLPGQNRSPSNTDDVSQCGGNYDAANYLDPAVVAALGGVTNYFAGTTNNASGVTDAAAPKPFATSGKIYASNGNFIGTCSGNDCTLVANDGALTISSDMLFRELRRSGFYTNDIHTMLDRMGECLRDQIAGGVVTANGKINDTCSLGLESFGPVGYYANYRDLALVARCPGCEVVVDDTLLSSCAGALLYANQRGTGQNRRDATDQALWSNYLENYRTTPTPEGNLDSFMAGGNLYRGPSRLGPVRVSRGNPDDEQRCAPGGIPWKSSAECQTLEQDIVRCIPSGPSQQTVSLDLSALFPGVGSLAVYDAARARLTLGASDVDLSSSDPNAGKLFACSWQADAHTRGSGFRSYFRFKVRDTGDGFTFAIVDDNRNPNIFNRCGAARQHLGYSGNNGYTLPLEYPKIAIEFDTSRNYSSTSPTGYLESANPLTNGRNDPCYRSSCGGQGLDNDSHVAIMYWGYQQANAGAGVTQPGQDDNVHGFPLAADPADQPAPRNATAILPHPFPPPYPPPAIAPVDRLRNTQTIKRDFHVRVEVTPQPRSAEDENLKRRTWQIEVWLEPTEAVAITSLLWTPDDPFNPGSPGVVTVTAPGHNFANGDTILIREAPGSFNGDYVIKNSDSFNGTFQFDRASNPGSSVIVDQAVAMKLTEAVARLRMISQPMAALAPVIKYNSCTSDADCAAGQTCLGADGSGMRYCYAGHRPTVYDRPVIYDPATGPEALQSIRLGITLGVGSSDQVIDISEFHTQWLP